MIDELRLPGIGSQTWQAAQPGALTALRELVDDYLAVLDVARGVRLKIGREIEAALADGYSFDRLNEASGLSIATIQKILVTAGVERTSSKS
jgi:hypothetical protein